MDCLVSAGPTREYWDPVRFLSNPSTGKMGYAVAEAARDAGWRVTLVSGPVALPPPAGVAVVAVETGAELEAALEARFPACRLLVMTAAVTDYRPVVRQPQKHKRSAELLSLFLEPVPDILAGLGRRRRPGQVLVGFAAETQDVEAYARRKLAEKNCDFIAANDLTEPGAGFATETNRLLLLGREGPPRVLGPASKRVVAAQLLAAVWPGPPPAAGEIGAQSAGGG